MKRRRATRRDEEADLVNDFPAQEISQHTADLRRIRSARRRPSPRAPLGSATYTFLAHSYEVTGDPAFLDAMRALKAYELDGKQASRRLDELETQFHDEANRYAEAVEAQLSEQKARGDEPSCDRAYAVVAARYEPEFVSRDPETSGFEAATQRIKRAHRRGRIKPDIGNFGTSITVVSYARLYEKIGGFDLYRAGTKTVPNNLEWRQRIASGQFVKLK